MNKERLLKNFLEFVQIDSETRNEKEFKDYLINYFEKLGLSVYEDNAGKDVGSNANNIYITIPGDESLEPIILSAHMDTVKPGNGIKPVVEGNRVVTESNTILGADDKAGVAVIVEAVESIIENNDNHRPIEIILTIFEEGGLFGAKGVEIERLKGTNILVFDTGGPISQVVNQSVSQYKVDFEVFGKAAHAGVYPEQGINALEVTSHAIANMKLGRIDFETTANIGFVSGGEGTNVVMPKVSMKGEARSHNEEKLKTQINHMISCFDEACKKFGAEFKVDTLREYPSFHTDPKSKFANEVSKFMKDMGHDTEFIKTGGGSDANIFSGSGKKALIISCGMDKVHTVNEFLEIDIFNQTADFLYRYLKG